jgi:hypothetical protein
MSFSIGDGGSGPSVAPSHGVTTETEEEERSSTKLDAKMCRHCTRREDQRPAGHLGRRCPKRSNPELMTHPVYVRAAAGRQAGRAIFAAMIPGVSPAGRLFWPRPRRTPNKRRASRDVRGNPLRPQGRKQKQRVVLPKFLAAVLSVPGGKTDDRPSCRPSGQSLFW